VRAFSAPDRSGAQAFILRNVHFSELTPVEQRVLGCLIEKRWTTPDQYPLSLNALRLACNQSTNRDPVTDYDESAVREAAQRLSQYGLTRLASGAGSRATKYRHLAEEALGLDREQLAVLCVLLLRGPQTPGELKSRSERMAHLPTLDDVERVVDLLIARGYAERLERRPGQKEERFRHLLGASEESTFTAQPPAAHAAPAATLAGPDPIAAGGFDEPVGAAAPYPADDHDGASAGRSFDAPPAANGDLEARVAALEAEVADLRTRLADLLE
jgi:uncharacterized protein YceH (UPF0502 family)